MEQIFSAGSVNLQAFGPVTREAWGLLACLPPARPLLDTDLLQCLLSLPESRLGEALGAADRESVLARLGGPVASRPHSERPGVPENRVGRMLKGILEDASKMAAKERCPHICESHLVRCHIDRLTGNTGNFYHRLGVNPLKVRAFMEANRSDRALPPKAVAPERKKEPTTTIRKPEPTADSPLFAGRYRIAGEIATGGMGVVYIAFDDRLLGSKSTRVAIKVMRPETREEAYLQRKFFQEFESLTRINHPNIVRILDRGEDLEKRSFIVMEYIDGVPLRAEIKAPGMQHERAARISRQIGSALSCFHDQKILHCDLKPDNIMLQRLGDGEELIKLIDFGVAKVAGSRFEAQEPGTRIGGTLYYSSPEHMNGQLEVSSDTWSFGVIMYELLTGVRPFNAETPRDMWEAQQKGMPTGPLRKVAPEAAVRAITKALAFDPALRHSRSRDFGEELAAALAAPTPVARPARPAQEVAYLLFVELMNLAGLPADRQMRMMTELTNLVQSAGPVQSASDAGDLHWLSPSDALVGAFLGDPSLPAVCAMEIVRLLTALEPLQVRMSIYNTVGFRSPTGELKVGIGDIAAARLLTQLGDAGHVLVSPGAADTLGRLSQWSDGLKDLGEHEYGGILFRPFNLCSEGSGNPSLPSKLGVQPKPVIVAPKPEIPTAKPVSQPEPLSPAVEEAATNPLPNIASAAPEPVTKKRVEKKSEAKKPAEKKSTEQPAFRAAAAVKPVEARATLTFASRTRAFLDRAESLVRGSGRNRMNTIDLFSAMLDEDDGTLSSHLSAGEVPVEMVRELFRRLATDTGAANPAKGPVKLSPNVETILAAADRERIEAGREQIIPSDLIQAFRRNRVGGVATALEALGVSFDAESSRPQTDVVFEFGDLREKDCTPEAWKTLTLAARLAAPQYVSSIDVWRALAADPQGAVSQAIERLGLYSPFGLPDKIPTDDLGNKTIAVEFSVTVAEVLDKVRGQATKLGQLVTSEQIFHAMLAVPDSQGVEMLRKAGLRYPPSLASSLFGRHGELNRERFDAAANSALDLAWSFAIEKNATAITVRHLLFGLLNNPGGLMERRLAEQGVNAAKVAGVLSEHTTPGLTWCALRRAYVDIDTALLDLLCGAERYAGGPAAAIGEEHVLRALHVRGAGDAAELLINNGVKWRRLA